MLYSQWSTGLSSYFRIFSYEARRKITIEQQPPFEIYMREGEALSPSLMIQNAVYGHQCWEKCVIFHVTYSKKYNRLWITWYKNVIIWHICQRSRKTKALNRQISDTSCCMIDMILIISLILVRLCFVQKSNVTLKKIVFFDFCDICLTYISLCLLRKIVLGE